MKSAAISKVAFIGNHIPRQCGLATFTSDVAEAVRSAGVEVQVVAMNDRPEGYDYPDVVKFQVNQNNLEDYHEAARYLNSQDIDLICVQHEYGIYGGPAGSYLLSLLAEVKVPIVTTLHTILQHPNDEQRDVLAELAQLSERLVVMSRRGRQMLDEVFDIDPGKVRIIHHGIPTVAKVDAAPYREKLGLKGKQLILTFGLIAPDKGIEHMISAMPAISAQHPDAYYLVVGATHPHVKRGSGETYRESLVSLSNDLNVAGNVGFVDRFVSLEDLTDYLRATDVYVTPYLKKEQITSGTLAYAYGSGNAVVSTPYWHAEELLAGGRGVIVPFRDSNALADQITGLLSDAEKLASIQGRALEEGKQMQWPVVGAEYVRTFEEAKEACLTLLPTLNVESGIPQDLVLDADLGLGHLMTLVDDTGIIQHATYCIPNRNEGYCTDDNARLAILGARLESDPGQANFALKMQRTGLAFMTHAYNERTRRMRNFMSYDRRWLDCAGSEDCHGRAIWALGTLVDESSSPGIHALARELLLHSLMPIFEFNSPRGIAFSILGLDRLLAATYSEDCFRAIKLLAGKLNDDFLRYATDDWPWFEEILTYDNARLPQALMAAGYLIGDDQMIAHSRLALRWLVGVQTDRNGCFVPIGSNGFYPKYGIRAVYDQQPVEAAATVDACFDAYRLTDEAHWQREVWKAYSWYLGSNLQKRSIVDEDTGGCRDGLMPGGVNENQGAESTLGFLTSTVTLRELELLVARRGNGYLG